MSKSKPECAAKGHKHHSNDRVKVWHGKSEPTILCGWHASPEWIKASLASLYDRSL